MQNQDNSTLISTPTALVTGGAKRIGAEIARTLHNNSMNIVLHYRSSANAAQTIVNELNSKRPNSATCFSADLLDLTSIPQLLEHAIEQFGRLDVLVNNASTFYPTPIELVTDEYWDDLVGSNLKAPAYLIKNAAPYLKKNDGCVVNIVDIYARRPLKNHPVYCSAKAGLEMLTKALAQDLAPDIRVNAVAPGAIIWPEAGNSQLEKADLIERIPLGRMGDPSDIAKTVLFLTQYAPYITGQTIAVDGGRSVVP